MATVAVLGPGAGDRRAAGRAAAAGLGPAGRAVAAVAAIVLTLGATNAYLSGATEMIGQLTAARRSARRSARKMTAGHVTAGPRTAGRRTADRTAGRRATFLLIIAASGLVLIGLYALHLVTTTALVALPTTMFLGVYLACTAAATRVLTGAARLAAWPALLAVATVLAFCGWALAAAAAVAAIAAVAAPHRSASLPPGPPHRPHQDGPPGWPRAPPRARPGAGPALR